MNQRIFLSPAELQPPETIKACCVSLYESDWATLLLGDSYHPGKLVLTERLGLLLDLQPGQRLLDVASGRGTSAIFLAERFGCQVVGVDIAPDIIKDANARAKEAGLEDLVHFEKGDGESLPFDDEAFDAIICECAFCTFPGKSEAADQFARVLRPGGRIGISDLTRSGPLPPELDTLMAWVACIADALPIEDYTSVLAGAGLKVKQVEIHDEALAELVDEVRGKLLGAELLVKLKKLDLPDWLDLDFDEIGRLARLTAEAVQRGDMGYALLVGEKEREL